MDCRTFHRNFEVYLEDGLDFAGRFGMERHADQCISCGKDLAAAQKLRSMIREIERVKAPEGFESSILNRIGNRKARGRFYSGLRRLWIYGLERPSLKLSLTFCSIAVAGFGVFLLSNSTPDNEPPLVSPVAVHEPAAVKPEIKPVAVSPVREAAPVAVKEARTEEVSKRPEVVPEVAVKATPVSVLPPSGPVANLDIAETDYVEYQMIGPDKRPVTLRFPLQIKTRMQSGQTHEEYFIRNVSH